MQRPLPRVVYDVSSARTALLEEFAATPLGADEARLKHFRPAFSRLQDRARRAVEIAEVRSFGTRVSEPSVSVVVTLYKRIDFLEHQLLQFAQDPEMLGVDLVYVLDSPELAPSLYEFAAAMYALHELPFRVVTLTSNGGFSTANNLGASIADSDLLLLLNSDVFPSEPGWLSQMEAFHAATPEIGALGPKLMFVDDSIQHAGMYFERDPVTRFWQNIHYFKGLTRDLPAANVARPVPAVTGACMLIERSLYEAVGGLSHLFVQGGYEDSDLCLRLLREGRRNWYAPQAELYHLEEQSFAGNARARTGGYNAWLQTSLWDGLIEDVMHSDVAAPA